MQVDPFDENLLSVDKQLAILDFNGAEADFMRGHFHHTAIGILECQ